MSADTLSFESKWNIVKHRMIKAFEVQRPENIYGLEDPDSEVQAIVTPVKDFLLAYGKLRAHKWEKVWQTSVDFANRLDDNKASFFELPDQFFYLVEKGQQARVIVADDYTIPTERPETLFKQQNLRKITTAGISELPHIIHRVWSDGKNPLKMVYKCFSAGEAEGDKDERRGNTILHAGYVNWAERDRSNVRIKFHIKTPVDKDMMSIYPNEMLWPMVEAEQYIEYGDPTCMDMELDTQLEL